MAPSSEPTIYRRSSGRWRLNRLDIELRKPWQNFIEAQFKVQLRLADFKIEHAQTLE